MPSAPNPPLFTPRFFLMCGYTFTVFLSLFQLLPTAPYRILELGGTTFLAGLFLGFLTYSSALSAPFTGALVDRVGRRRVLIVSSLAIAGFAVAYAFTTSPRLLLALVVVHGVFWSGLLSASAAHVTSLIPPSRRAEGLSYWSLSTVFATAAAPALGLFIYHRGGWRWLCGSILVLDLVMAAIAFALEESGGTAAVAGAPARSVPGVGRDGPVLEWRVFVVSLSLFVCSFGYGGITSFVALDAERHGIEPRAIFFVVFSIAVLATRPFAGRLADRIGYRRVLVPGFVLVVAGLTALALATTRGTMAAAALLFGIGFGNLYPIFVAHVMRHVDDARRGAAFGGILAAFDTGIGTGSIALGWVIERRGFPSAYGFAAGLSALAIPMFLLLDRWLLRGREQA